MVDEAKALILLSEISSIENAQIVRLSNKSFSYEAASAISIRLKTFPSVRIADLSDIIAGRPEEEALKTLTVICNSFSNLELLTEVNLSENALGVKGINACRPVLTGKNIEKLYLCNNGLSAESCSLVTEILLEGGCPGNLKVLHFYNNMSGSAGGVAVANLLHACKASGGRLEDFRFSATRSGNEGCLAIAMALQGLSRITHIDLSDTTFGLEAAIALAHALTLQSGLKHLNLRDAGLTGAGVIAILNSLSTLPVKPALEFLDISGNDISEEEMADVGAAIAGGFAGTLQELYLDDNEIASEGAVALCTALTKTSKSAALRLRKLSMCSCDLTARGAYYIARLVSKIPRFQSLALNGNRISERAVKEITTLLTRENKILESMDENEEEEDEGDFEDLLQELEDLDLKEAISQFSRYGNNNSTSISTVSSSSMSETVFDNLIELMAKSTLNSSDDSSLT